MTEVLSKDTDLSDPVSGSALAVRVWAIVGSLKGCRASQVDDPEQLGHWLKRCVQAAGLTLLHCHVHKFEPEGVTASAVLAESHIALHSWPTQGVLFLDIATCASREATQAAFDCLRAQVDHEQCAVEHLIVE